MKANMEAVICVGLQGAGKSTFCKERFFTTHIRVNLDMLRTRHREKRLVQLCLEISQPFVVDNTNPSRAERAVYIQAAREFGFRVVGYYFQSRVEECHRRNLQRTPSQQVPFKGVLGTAGRMQVPTREEGFDELYYVRIDDVSGFVIQKWHDEVR